MQSFSEFLLEKRRNPEQNPRIPIIDKIMEYSNKSSDSSPIYVSFRDINKLGINLTLNLIPNLE